MDNFWIFECSLPADQFLIFEETVGDLVESLNWGEGVVKGMIASEYRNELEKRLGRLLRWSRLEPIDWLENDERQLLPIEAGRFFIYTPYYEGSIPEDKISLQLRSSHAFGSGHHPTTKGCLALIQQLAKVDNVLDVGCGSGILALAAAKYFNASVIGTEIDQKSAALAEDNAKGLVKIVVCDGVSADEVVQRAPFDLIVSNIHSGPLCKMASDLEKLLKDQGVLILAGLLKEQRVEVESAYKSVGLTLKIIHSEDPEWPVLQFQKYLN